MAWWLFEKLTDCFWYLLWRQRCILWR